MSSIRKSPVLFKDICGVISFLQCPSGMMNTIIYKVDLSPGKHPSNYARQLFVITSFLFQAR
jgi:hypothetical protein